MYESTFLEICQSSQNDWGNRDRDPFSDAILIWRQNPTMDGNSLTLVELMV